MQTNFAVEPEIAITLAPDQDAPQSVGRDAYPARILYAEDNNELREISAASLRRAGYDVVTVPDGGQAWQELHSSEFDLLITDNEMPCLTGLELIAKAQREEMALDVILASGALGQLRGPALGTINLRARLQKPFSHGELLAAVKHAIDARSELKRQRAREDQVLLTPIFEDSAANECFH